MDLDDVVGDVLLRSQPRQRLGDLATGLVQDLGQLDRLVHRRLDAVEAEEVGDLLGEVQDVVEARRQREDVLAVDRRDERRVELVDDVVGDPVALLLGEQDLPGQVRPLRPALQHLLEHAGGLHDVRGGLLEEVVELALLRHEEL